MNASDGRRHRRAHSAEFKAKVIAACRTPGVSIAAVALANSLNANLLRRWVVAEERVAEVKAIAAVGTPARFEVESPSFIPLEIKRPAVTKAQEINVELRRGPTVIKIAWPVSAAADCAAWLRELLR